MKNKLFLAIALLFAVNTWQCTRTDAPQTAEKQAPELKQDTVRWSCIRPPKIENLERSVVVNGKPWPVGKVFRVKLLSSGTAAQNNHFHAATDTVAKWANVNFDYSPRPDNTYDLRVQLNNYGAAWSYLGQDATFVSQTSPSLVVGWTGFDVSSHELLHAMGFAHEQSNPNVTICWNKPVVYEELKRTNGWSQAQVDYNVFYTYPLSGVAASTFDPLSIMQYTIKGSWTCNGVGISGGKNLSPLDRAALVATYPGRTTPPIVTGITITAQQAAELRQGALNDQTATNTANEAAKAHRAKIQAILGN